MLEVLDALHDRLAPAEKMFFTWLARVFAAATLVGVAWIDDAPPLELGALIIALYVVVRVVTQLRAFATAAPFEHRVLKAFFALGCLVLLATAFLSIAIFAERVAMFVVG